MRHNNATEPFEWPVYVSFNRMSELFGKKRIPKCELHFVKTVDLLHHSSRCTDICTAKCALNCVRNDITCWETAFGETAWETDEISRHGKIGGET